MKLSFSFFAIFLLLNGATAFLYAHPSSYMVSHIIVFSNTLKICYDWFSVPKGKDIQARNDLGEQTKVFETSRRIQNDDKENHQHDHFVQVVSTACRRSEMSEMNLDKTKTMHF